MIDWLLGGQVERLFWARQVPTAVTLAAFAAAVVLTVFLYRRDHGLPARVRLVLAASRLVVLGLIVAVVLEPIVAVKRTDTLKRRLAILVDTSGSMSVTDQRKRSEDIVEAASALGMLRSSETTDVNRAAMALDAKQRQTIAGASRLDLVRSLLSRSARPTFESIRDDLGVSYYAFGRTLHKLGDGGSGAGDYLAALQADASGTSIAESLEAAAGSNRGVPLAGILLFSDGIDTSSRRAETAVHDLGARHSSLHRAGGDCRSRRRFDPERDCAGSRLLRRHRSRPRPDSIPRLRAAHGRPGGAPRWQRRGPAKRLSRRRSAVRRRLL